MRTDCWESKQQKNLIKALMDYSFWQLIPCDVANIGFAARGFIQLIFLNKPNSFRCQVNSKDKELWIWLQERENGISDTTTKLKERTFPVWCFWYDARKHEMQVVPVSKIQLDQPTIMHKNQETCSPIFVKVCFICFIKLFPAPFRIALETIGCVTVD